MSMACCGVLLLLLTSCCYCCCCCCGCCCCYGERAICGERERDEQTADSYTSMMAFFQIFEDDGADGRSPLFFRVTSLIIYINLPIDM